ncbi:hypothetical protein FO519_006262 [Halicephalobus sp. NKZ332]|nr:hypothetical protein FO519_006262 [Halicephalobus sp. NKZ332]
MSSDSDSFKGCGLTPALDGTEDDKIHSQFDNSHSVCLKRVNALSRSNPRGLSFEHIVERVNVKGDEFQVETFAIDAAKLLIVVFDLCEKSHKQTRAFILKIMAEKPKAVFQEVVAQCRSQLVRVTESKLLEKMPLFAEKVTMI